MPDEVRLRRTRSSARRLACCSNGTTGLKPLLILSCLRGAEAPLSMISRAFMGSTPFRTLLLISDRLFLSRSLPSDTAGEIALCSGVTCLVTYAPILMHISSLRNIRLLQQRHGSARQHADPLC